MHTCKQDIIKSCIYAHSLRLKDKLSQRRLRTGIQKFTAMRFHESMCMTFKRQPYQICCDRAAKQVDPQYICQLHSYLTKQGVTVHMGPCEYVKLPMPNGCSV